MSLGDDEKCSICREEMDGTEPDYMLRCNHRFHTECIVNSLRKNPDCPVCRDRGTDDLTHDDDDDGGDLADYTNWFQSHNKHNKTCTCCAWKDPENEYYEIFQMIKTVGEIQNKELLKEYKTSHSKIGKYELKILKEYKTQHNKIKKLYERHRELLFRSMGKSTMYAEYKQMNKDYKVIRIKLKNAIIKEFVNMGYEIDKEMTDLVYEYINRRYKLQRRSWRFKNIVTNMARYTLDKYAPKEGETLPTDTINNLEKTIEI